MISRRLDPETMTARLGLRELAAEACISLTTARIHVRDIVRHRHLEWERGNGRGNKSVFRPLTRRPFVIIPEGRS